MLSGLNVAIPDALADVQGELRPGGATRWPVQLPGDDDLSSDEPARVRSDAVVDSH